MTQVIEANEGSSSGASQFLDLVQYLFPREAFLREQLAPNTPSGIIEDAIFYARARRVALDTMDGCMKQYSTLKQKLADIAYLAVTYHFDVNLRMSRLL
jgi:hypothetical protein